MIEPKDRADGLPALTDPVVVVAFEGWNDAGDAATGAVEHLELIWDATPLAALDTTLEGKIGKIATVLGQKVIQLLGYPSKADFVKKKASILTAPA